MRIGIDATSLPRAVAGAGKYILGLINGLAQLDVDHTFFIYCKERDRNMFGDLPANFRMRTVANFSRPRRILWQLHGLQANLVRDDIEVWHATHYIVPQVHADYSVVVTIHDLAFIKFPELYSPVKRRFFGWAIRQAIHRADECIAVSSATQRDVAACFPEAKPCHIVHSGIHDAFFRTGNGDGSPYPRRYILAVGTQERRKNYPLLVRAFSQVAADLPLVDLVLAGQPENDTPAIKREVAQAGLRERTLLPGYVPERELLSLYRHAALVCQPSHYEGFGFPALEAMAAGIPVIVSDRPATAELVGEFARKVPPECPDRWAAAMREALAHAPGKGVLSQAQRHVQRFSWRETAQQTVAIYESCKNGRAPARRPSQKAVDIANVHLSEAVLRTVVFSDLFDYPLLEKELHAGLLFRAAGELEVREAVRRMRRSGALSEKEGYYFLPGREETVRIRRQREQNTRALLAKYHDDLQAIVDFPFVRAVALSGSAAFGNCRPDDDLDLFVICHKKRLWLVYAMLALFFKLQGKRRALCLNYLIAEGAEDTLERNVFVAHQIAHLRPVYFQEGIDRYRERHAWFRNFLHQGGIPGHLPLLVAGKKKFHLEKLFGSRLFDFVETITYHSYRRRIRTMTQDRYGSGVRCTRTVIRLFTNDHMPAIMTRFRERCARVLRSGEPGL